MTTAAKTSFGAELWLAPHGQSLVMVAELTSIEPPVPARDTIDVTTHDSPAGAMEFITEGVYDPGEIKFQGNYIAGSAGDTAMITAMTGGALQDFKVVLKGTSGTDDLTGSGFMTSYGPDSMETKGKQSFSGAMKVSGEVTQA